MLTMISHAELFRYKRMPPGLLSTPATLQRIIDMTRAGLKWKCCLAYIDDIIIFSRKFLQHKPDVREVFQRIRTVESTLKFKKHEFARQSLVYLGHITDLDGVRSNTDRGEAVHDFKPPTNLCELRSFLGMVGFFRMFIKYF